MRNQTPYQIALVAGPTPPEIDKVAESIVTITPTGSGTLAEQVIEGLRRSNVTPADLRARALFVTNLPSEHALAIYAAIAGFAGRHVDVATPVGIAYVERIARAGRDAVDAGKPSERADCVLVGADQAQLDAVSSELAQAALAKLPEGAEVPDVRVVNVEVGAGVLDAQTVSELRWAKRVRLEVPSALDGAITRFALVAGIRARRGQERFAALIGDVDLDGIRQEAGALRRSLRAAGTEVAPAEEPTPRRARLNRAADVDIETVLANLGSNTDGKLWQCPRPQSHTHGDATPSLRIDNNRVCCYVDDAEWVDPLRLVMDTLALGPDDAADLLLDLEAPDWQAAREEILALRASKAGK